MCAPQFPRSDLQLPLCEDKRPTIDRAAFFHPQEASRQGNKRDGFPRILALALVFLLCNALAAIYRGRRNPLEIAFVVGSSLNLVGLFVAVEAYQSSPAEASRRRRRLRLTVWALATTLNFAFSFRVAAIMPAAISIALWGLAALVALVGLWLVIFGCSSDDGKGGGTGGTSPGSRV